MGIRMIKKSKKIKRIGESLFFFLFVTLVICYNVRIVYKSIGVTVDG